jgi:hypothetical protein
MTVEHRYKLQQSSVKHLCPNCNKRRFVRYIDTVKDEVLPEIYGRCDREANCSYQLNPYKDGYAKNITEQERGNITQHWTPKRTINRAKPNKPEPVFIPFDVLQRTLKPEGYEQNTFIQNLLSRVPFPFEANEVEKVVSLYYLGTIKSGYRAGGITFSFIDQIGNIRAIQVKQFDESNHTTGTDFLHSIIDKHYQKKSQPAPEWLEGYKTNEIKVSCLFGEHNLNKYPHNPIALVEAPKTAIYGTLYFGFPEQATNLLWLAVYNLSSLNFEKCKALIGRDVYLFPDLSKDGKAFELWTEKAKELESKIQGAKFTVSNLLEQRANEIERANGCDLADYLIKQDWRTFQPHQLTEPQKAIEPKPVTESEKGEKGEPEKTNIFCTKQEQPTEKTKSEPPTLWNIEELETFFNSANIPTQPIRLNQCCVINNPSLFISGHLATVKHNSGKRTFLPYLYRLEQFREILTQM